MSTIQISFLGCVSIFMVGWIVDRSVHMVLKLLLAASREKYLSRRICLFFQFSNRPSTFEQLNPLYTPFPLELAMKLISHILLYFLIDNKDFIKRKKAHTTTKEEALTIPRLAK